MLYFGHWQGQVRGLREWWNFAVQLSVQRRQSFVVHDWMHFRRSWRRRRKTKSRPSHPKFIGEDKLNKGKGFYNMETKPTQSLKFWKFNEIDSVSLTCCLAARNGWILNPALFVIVPKAARFCPCCVALACPSSILAFFKALLSALSWKLFVIRNANDILTRKAVEVWTGDCKIQRRAKTAWSKTKEIQRWTNLKRGYQRQVENTSTTV